MLARNCWLYTFCTNRKMPNDQCIWRREVTKNKGNNWTELEELLTYRVWRWLQHNKSAATLGAHDYSSVLFVCLWHAPFAKCSPLIGRLPTWSACVDVLRSWECLWTSAKHSTELNRLQFRTETQSDRFEGFLLILRWPVIDFNPVSVLTCRSAPYSGCSGHKSTFWGRHQDIWVSG